MSVATLILLLPVNVFSFCFQCTLLSKVGTRCDPSQKYTGWLVIKIRTFNMIMLFQLSKIIIQDF